MTLRMSDIPSQPGVYRIIDLDGETAYVGQTGSSIRSRLRQHFVRQDSSVVSYGRLDPWDIRQVDWWVTESGEAKLAEQQLLSIENPYLNFGQFLPETSERIINSDEPNGRFHLVKGQELEFRRKPYYRAKRKLEHMTRMLDKIKFADHSDQTRGSLYEHLAILEENIDSFLDVEKED